MSDKCECRNIKGIHRIAYSPGSCEAVVQCQDCGAFYYDLLYERMSFDSEDMMDEYRIPITQAEKERLIAGGEQQPDISYLKGRQAKVIFQGNTTEETTAEMVLSICGRL